VLQASSAAGPQERSAQRAAQEKETSSIKNGKPPAKPGDSKNLTKPLLPLKPCSISKSVTPFIISLPSMSKDCTFTLSETAFSSRGSISRLRCAVPSVPSRCAFKTLRVVRICRSCFPFVPDVYARFAERGFFPVPAFPPFPFCPEKGVAPVNGYDFLADLYNDNFNTRFFKGG
jgi:hypothetical protein